MSYYRYVILLLYSLGTIVNNVSSYIYLPLQTMMSEIYGLNLALITFFTNYISNITYLIGVPISNYIAERHGLKAATLVGTFFTLVGWWVSVACEYTFLWLIIGQVFFGVTFPFFNMPQKMSGDWFECNERDRATSIFNIFYQLGASVGALAPQFFVNQNATGTPALQEIVQMLFWTSALSTVVCIPIFTLFKHKESKWEKEEESPKGLRDLLRDRNYVILLIGSSTAIAVNLAFIGNVQPLLFPYNISQDAVSTMITLGVVAACIGTLAIGSYITKTKKYKLALILSSGFGTIFLAVLWFVSVTFENSTYSLIVYLFYNLAVSDIAPLGWEFLVELAYPANEATAGSLMMTIGQSFGAVLGVALSALLNDETLQEANISFFIIIGIQAFSTLCLFFVEERLNRFNEELAKKLKNSCIEAEDLTHEVKQITEDS